MALADNRCNIRDICSKFKDIVCLNLSTKTKNSTCLGQPLKTTGQSRYCILQYFVIVKAFLHNKSVNNFLPAATTNLYKEETGHIMNPQITLIIYY